MTGNVGTVILFVFIGVSAKFADDYLDEFEDISKGWLWSIVAGSLCGICVCQSILAGIICGCETCGCLVTGKINRKPLICIPLGVLVGWIIGLQFVWSGNLWQDMGIMWIPLCFLGSVIAQTCNNSKEISKKSHFPIRAISRHGLAGACLLCYLFWGMPFAGTIWVIFYESAYGFTKMYIRRAVGTWRRQTPVIAKISKISSQRGIQLSKT